ncbi:methionine--tRNA ligase [Lyticum sinuosum]|uniref:Methionine--tRNA ligase n=1 Tax=Lyticum sinuosum TaxID=1332059 RepID=A0AAE4VKG0_9RICK|nr:methionine--tRNA ligase [Lyticum sinuosum]MDZ5760988.1 Methionine--tRNA ligase [Lyticum sinuosum]
MKYKKDINKYYVTTPIYYVNDKPHIGHAYTTIIADTLARSAKINNNDVFFLTGTDEHGKKVEQKALSLGITPQELVDDLAPSFKTLSELMSCYPSYFIRTTNNKHKNFVQKIWKEMEKSGKIYLGKYSGWYANSDECFYEDSEIIDGRAPTGAKVEWLEEECYFFKLSEFKDDLLEFYKKNPDFIKPKERYNEVIKFVNNLRDLCISRSSCSWGINVPDTEKKHVIYVWLDALFNYISALYIVFDDNEFNDDKPIDLDILKEYFWPCNLHIIGKDILMFHAVYWPAFLMSLNITPPHQILAHGWWTNEGQKISKSIGNVIDPLEIIKTIPADWLRYFMLREVPLGLDGNYSELSLKTRINADLVNNIGNLIQRSISLIVKYFDGIIDNSSYDYDTSNKLEFSLKLEISKLNTDVHSLTMSYKIHEALEKIIMIGRMANIYIDRESPWNLKNDLLKMHKILKILAEVIIVIGIAFQPFMPIYSLKILEIFGIKQNIFIIDKKFAINKQIENNNFIFDEKKHDINYYNKKEHYNIINSLDLNNCILYENAESLIKDYNKIKLPKNFIFPRIND